MEDLAQKYVNELAEDEDFIRLCELKKIIDKNYALQIISMKTKESLYNDALSHPEYSDVKKAQRELSQAKAALYEKPEVKEYFILERKLNERLKKDMQALMDSISSHFPHNAL